MKNKEEIIKKDEKIDIKRSSSIRKNEGRRRGRLKVRIYEEKD